MWKEQYERILRHRNRLNKKSIPISLSTNEISVEYLNRISDDVYNFFIHCDHFGDWLIKSNSIPKSEIEELRANHWELALCHDICNGIKHLEIHNHLSNSKDPHKERGLEIAHSYDRGGGKYVAVEISVPTQFGMTSARQLADSCIRIWENYLRKRDLI